MNRAKAHAQKVKPLNGNRGCPRCATEARRIGTVLQNRESLVRADRRAIAQTAESWERSHEQTQARSPVREDRIHNEAIVDASPDEQAMSWHYLPGRQDQFPVSGEVYCRDGCFAAQERRNHEVFTHGR